MAATSKPVRRAMKKGKELPKDEHAVSELNKKLPKKSIYRKK